MTRGAVFVTAATLMLAPVSAFAQVGSVAGTVRDSVRAGLPGVVVEVAGSPLIEKTRTTVTDQDGRYQFVNLPVGTYYKVTFKGLGFLTAEHGTFDLRQGITVVVDAEMRVAPPSPPLITALGSDPFHETLGEVLLLVPARVPSLSLRQAARAASDFERCGAMDGFTAYYGPSAEVPKEVGAPLSVQVQLWVHSSPDAAKGWSMGRCLSMSPRFLSEENFRGGTLKRYATSDRVWYQFQRFVVIVSFSASSQSLVIPVLESIADAL